MEREQPLPPARAHSPARGDRAQPDPALLPGDAVAR